MTLQLNGGNHTTVVLRKILDDMKARGMMKSLGVVTKSAESKV